MIPILDDGIAVLATRHDVSITLHGEPPAGQVDSGKQLDQGKRGFKRLSLAVDVDSNHGMKRGEKGSDSIMRASGTSNPDLPGSLAHPGVRMRLIRTTTCSWRSDFITRARCCRFSTCSVKLSTE